MLKSRSFHFITFKLVCKISDLPHQYKNLQEFQKKIAQPIGRTWNTEAKFKKLTQPKVKTKMGMIIEPIDKDDTLVLNKSKNKKFKK